MSDKQDELQPIIVKKIVKGGGHHGGAWKVAYADFVTAMMAFFLLLWLLSVATEEQKTGIADYFSPAPKVSESQSGAGGILGGNSMAEQGALAENKQQLLPSDTPQDAALRDGEGGDEYTDEVEIEEKISLEEIYKQEVFEEELARFEEAKEELIKAVEKDPELQKLSDNLLIDMTPEGMRIQIVDKKGKAMFPSGSAKMFEKMEKLLKKISTVIDKMPNDISIRGHTDAVPYGKKSNYTNWELSADRANASRRVLLDAGFSPEKINNIVGKSDTDPLYPDKPKDPQNRRISIIVLHEDLTTKSGANMSAKSSRKVMEKREKALYKRSSGNVDFP